MTELRKRMIESLQLRGYSIRTQDCYVRAVRQLAEHYHKSPDLITEEELRQYFLFIINVKKWSRPTTTIALCGIKFFFEHTLNRQWTILSLVRPAPEHKLPVILSIEEVRKILSLVRFPRYRVCLTTVYSCGLRLQEGTHLQVPDIDSSRMMLHVRHGKGNILFRASSEALQKLASDPRLVGGRVGMVGCLHTWTRALVYHPQIHYIVTGGGLNEEGRWRSSRENFLVPVRALSALFRTKVRDELKKVNLFAQVSPAVWKKDWVVHCEGVGNGEAAFKYLAPYIFRVAISNKRILKLESGKVTFQYKESATDQIKTCALTAEEFMRRFLQRVLPERFVKVRYYGLMGPSNRHLLKEARDQMSGSRIKSSRNDKDAIVKERLESLRCPVCGIEMRLIERLKPRSREPP